MTITQGPSSATTNPDVQVALMVRLDAKPEHAAAVAQMLADGRAVVLDEPHTPYWFAARMSPTSFGIFDAFPTDADRTAHLQGRLATSLLAKAPVVLASAPAIDRVEIIGRKHATSSAVTVGLVAQVRARPERAGEVEALLASGEQIVAAEPGTTVWFALKLDATRFAIFDAFATAAARQAHIEGKLARTLVSRAGELLAEPPVIEPIDILASKLP